MKINKYDRQIRLWGPKGQKRLTQARIALLSCTGAGVEALKNLVLPGVGHIQIWDHRKLELKDLATCFFYTPNDIGRFRCEAALQNLLEMNPDVKGQCHKVSPLSLFEESKKQLLSSYSLLVVGGELSVSELVTISKQCWQLAIPVVFINVLGFYIYVRNQKNVHTVEFERTAAKKYYLRLDNPFQELQAYSQQWNIQQMIERVKQLKSQEEQEWAKRTQQQLKAGTSSNDKQEQYEPSAERSSLLKQLSAIPYPVILMQLYQSAPKEVNSKNDILQKLKNYSMILGEGYRDNFVQASSRYFDLMQSPQNFLRGLDRFEIVSMNEAATEPGVRFLVGVKTFLEKEGYLPQLTDLPDMETETALFIALKEVYKKQHQKDLDKLENILTALNLHKSQPCQITRKDLSDFVNNLEAIYSYTYQPYYEELLTQQPKQHLKWIDFQGSWRNQLLALRACLEHHQRTGNAPTPKDQAEVINIISLFKATYGFDSMTTTDDSMESVVDLRYVREMLRVEGHTTISVASIAGAIAGQEAVKLLTHCFTPVKNGFVYSGIDGKGNAVELI